MRKLLTLLATAVMVCVLAMPVRAAEEPDEALHKKCLYPVVLVTPENREACGTGVIVRSTRVKSGEYRNVFVTCAHVAHASTADYVVKVFTYKDWSTITKTEKFPCEFVFADDDADLAVGVFSSSKELPVSEIDFNTKLYFGSQVLRIGCGLGDEPRLDEGKITSVQSNLSSLKGVYRTNVHTLPGDSGSPLFAKKKVVGIAQAIRVFRFGVGPQPVFSSSYYIPIGRLKELDEKNSHILGFAWGEAEIPQMPLHRMRLRLFDKVGQKTILP